MLNWVFSSDGGNAVEIELRGWDLDRADELAAEIRERKIAVIERARARSGATVVASANPGCSMHLAAVLDLQVRHPVDIVAEALGVAGR